MYLLQPLRVGGGVDGWSAPHFGWLGVVMPHNGFPRPMDSFARRRMMKRKRVIVPLVLGLVGLIAVSGIRWRLREAA